MGPGPSPASAVGVVLCGGSSRRMGADKATLLLDGTAMARRVADVLREFGAGTVLTVGGDGRALEGVGDRHVEDELPGEGPLGGVATAAAAAPGRDLVVVACDLPDLDPGLLRTLWAATGRQVAVPSVAGQVQWAVAMVPAPAAVLVAERFAAGERSLRAGFGDVDTPDDVERWRRRSGPRG